MEKIMLDFKQKTNVKKKFGSQEVIIQPYVEMGNLIAFAQLAIDKRMEDKMREYNEETTLDFNLTDSVSTQGIFDLLIIDNVSNVEVEGIEYDELLSSGFIKFVTGNVFNYEYGCRLLDIAINNHNIQSCFIDMVNENMDTSKTEDMLSKLTDKIGELDPKTLDALMKGTLEGEIKKQVKEDTINQTKKELKDHKKKVS